MPSPSVSAWRRLKFSDIAESVSDRVDDPSQAGVDRYVGLEHLDPERLSIRRWGSPSDVEATKLRFQPGDVIFGRRRAYQRKLAQADFTGICSAHAMVLRAKTDAVLPEFLPLLMQTDHFFKRALAISVGGLSPTINWKALAKEEFAVPSLDEQRHFCEVLLAAVKVRDEWESVGASVRRLVDAAVTEFMEELDEGVVRPLGDALRDVKYGTSARCGVQQSGYVPVLRIPNVVTGQLDTTDLKWTQLTESEVGKYSVDAGDLLLVRTNGNPDYVARGALIRERPRSPLAFASYLLRIRVDQQQLRPEYLELVMTHPRTRTALTHLIRSSAGNYNLSATGLQSLPVPVPSLADQDRLVDRVASLNADMASVEAHVAATGSMYTALREEWLDACAVQ